MSAVPTTSNEDYDPNFVSDFDVQGDYDEYDGSETINTSNDDSDEIIPTIESKSMTFIVRKGDHIFLPCNRTNYGNVYC